MIYKTKVGKYRKIIIKDSPKSFEYLKNRFSTYKGLLIVEDNKVDWTKPYDVKLKIKLTE